MAAQDTLRDEEKQNVLELLSSYFEFLQQQEGYLWYDLLVLHPGTANLYSLAVTYSRYHTHTTSEALYMLAGEAIYSFVRPDGDRFQLLVQPQDYLHIPAGVEHWFSPAASLHVRQPTFLPCLRAGFPAIPALVMCTVLNKLTFFSLSTAVKTAATRVKSACAD